MSNSNSMPMMVLSWCATTTGRITSAPSSSTSTSQRIGPVLDSNPDGPSPTLVVSPTLTKKIFWRDMLKTHNSSLDQLTTLRLCSPWLKLAVVYHRTVNTLNTHSLRPSTMLPSVFSNFMATKATCHLSTRMPFISCLQLREKERIVVDASSRPVPHTSSFVPLRWPERLEISTSLYTSTKPWETWPSRECSIQVTRTRPRSKSCHSSFLRRLRSLHLKLHSGRFNSWRNLSSTWWQMRMLEHQFHQTE